MRKWMTLVALAAVACAHKQKQPEVVAEAPPPAPPPERVEAPPPAPEPQKSEEDLYAILRGAVLHFDFDRAELRPESRSRLDRVAEALKAHPAARVRISGHCDELGTEEYNFALGQRRAEVAKKYLVTLGIDPSRIETVSYGEERPAAPGKDEAAYAQNRRDELEPI